MIHGIKITPGILTKGLCILKVTEFEYEIIFKLIPELYKMQIYNFEITNDIKHGKGISECSYEAFIYELGVRFNYIGKQGEHKKLIQHIIMQEKLKII